MKKRFYVDVPEMGGAELTLYATTTPATRHMGDGWKRIAFDVDFPPTVLKTHDDIAVSKIVGEI